MLKRVGEEHLKKQKFAHLYVFLDIIQTIFSVEKIATDVLMRFKVFQVGFIGTVDARSQCKLYFLIFRKFRNIFKTVNFVTGLLGLMFFENEKYAKEIGLKRKKLFLLSTSKIEILKPIKGFIN